MKCSLWVLLYTISNLTVKFKTSRLLTHVGTSICYHLHVHNIDIKLVVVVVTVLRPVDDKV